MGELTSSDLDHVIDYMRTLQWGTDDRPLAMMLPLATHSPWRRVEFLSIYARIMDHTLVDLYRAFELYEIALQMSVLDGAFLEVGVWRGGTGCLLAMAAPHRHVFLCDTFRGVPKAGDRDTSYVGGEHDDTSMEIVEGLLRDNKVNFNTSIFQGIFPEDTSHHLEGQTFSLCHIDVDTYSSAKDVFLWVWERMVGGGIVVFDDYGFPEMTGGVTDLVEELRDTTSDCIFIYNLNGHALFVKR